MIHHPDYALLEPFVQDIVQTYLRWKKGGQLPVGCMVVQLGDPAGSGFNPTYKEAVANWFRESGHDDIATAVARDTPADHARLILRVRVAVPKQGFSTYPAQILDIIAGAVDRPGQAPNVTFKPAAN